jgi:hypothetical protein
MASLSDDLVFAVGLGLENSLGIQLSIIASNNMQLGHFFHCSAFEN